MARLFRWFLLIVLCGSILGSGLAYYAFKYEPYHSVVREFTLTPVPQQYATLQPLFQDKFARDAYAQARDNFDFATPAKVIAQGKQKAPTLTAADWRTASVGKLAQSPQLWRSAPLSAEQRKLLAYDIATQPIELRVVQITDTHLYAGFTAEHLQRIVDKVNALHPDVVIFSGDLFDFYNKYPDDLEAIAPLARVQATYAKLAIWGNRDYYAGSTRAYPRIMAQAGFTLLTNQDYLLDLPNGQSVLFTGLDDYLFGKPKLPRNNYGKASIAYRWLLIHEPEMFDVFAAAQYDMALAGHSHGGQIYIPLPEKVVNWAYKFTKHDSPYRRGFYNQEGYGIQQLYVNPGIGTTLIHARLGVRPEIALFKIYVEPASISQATSKQK